MAVVTMRQLLDSGVHFGHQTRRWNPKMKRFILTERNGIYIIDLQQSIEGINTAYDFVKEIVARGGNILFVGTKKQAQAAVAEQAQRVGMPYVNQRWLGGMLTNFSTVRARLDRMKELEQIDFDDVAGSGRTKKEHLAISEAQKLGIPVIAILDTNCDPDEATYGIPGNDDAIRAVTLLTRVVADATAEGLLARSGGRARTGEEAEVAPADAEPLPEWEAQLLAGAEADAPAAEAAETAEAPAAEQA